MGEAPAATSAEDAPFPLTDIDRWVLSQTDEEYQKHTWEDLKEIIDTNNLSVLKRTPSELRAYMAWTSSIKKQYGSITTYILTHRLPASWGTPPFIPASMTPLQNPDDYKILLNDWPYGVEEDIYHIVVWSRTLIPVKEGNGDVTEESREAIEGFVRRIFRDDVGEARGEEGTKVLWFKNWVSLQSVRSLEHFHVLVRGVSEEMVEKWTGDSVKGVKQRRLKAM